MAKISAVIIAKNEEKMISDCIKSVLFCDEIIVIDNNSTDNTVQIAKKMGVKVYEYKTNDFSQARNYGKKVAQSEWIFYVDADERVSKHLVREVLHIVKLENNPYAAYKIKRKNLYLGNHPWPKIERLERLFKKEALEKWYGKLHESPKVKGKLGDLDGYLIHFTHRTLSEMLTKTIAWSTTEAKLRYDAHHPPVVWWRFPRVMLSAFFDSYVAQEGFKVGTVGLIESIYQSFSAFVTYARLWELQNTSALEK